MSEEEIAEMLNDCLHVYDEDPDTFTEWEQGFLDTLREVEDYKHLSPSQEDKLEQIWEKRVA